MFTRPNDLSDTEILRVLFEGWNIDADQVAYAAVGFGSHHWHVTAGSDRWFLTVDDLDARRDHSSEARESVAQQLRWALTIAQSLRNAGLAFVIAPLDAVGRHVTHPIDERYVAALYPYVDGEYHAYGAYQTANDRLAVLDRLVEIHSLQLGGVVATKQLEVPRRAELARHLDNPATAWGPGPFAARAKALLGNRADALMEALSSLDRDIDALHKRQPVLVITHGEPHRGNTIDTRDGVVLIDWDTAQMAPPERDLWVLIEEDPSIADAYAERTGVVVDQSTVAMYRRHWDLSEISLFAADLRAPHRDSEDTQLAWTKLQECVDRATTSR